MANGLGSLLAKSKQETGHGIQAADDSRPNVGGSGTDAAGDGRVASDSSAESAPRSASPGQSTAKANPFARKAAAAQPSSPQAAPAEEPPATVGGPEVPASGKPKLAGLKFAQPPTSRNRTDSGGHSAEVQPVRAENLESLADLELLEEEGTAPRPTRSSFSDETPASKPTRELPEGLEKQQLQFVDLIDGVYEILHDPELLGNVIKSIMIELKSNPQYMKLIAPDDVRTWVRAMRDSMGLARVKKQETKSKRSNGGSRAGSKLVDTDMLQDLNDLGISFD